MELNGPLPEWMLSTAVGHLFDGVVNFIWIPLFGQTILAPRVKSTMLVATVIT